MAADFSNIDTTFNAALSEALRPGGYFPEGSFTAYNLDGKTNLNLPINISRIADNLADVTNNLPIPNEEIGKVTLSADEPIKTNTWIGDQDIEDHGISIVGEYAKGVATDIMEGEAHRMSAFLIKTALDAGQYTVIDDEKSGSETWDEYFTRQQHAIDLGLQSLRMRHVKGAYYGLVYPSLFTAANKSQWAGSADYNANAMTGIPQRRLTVSNSVLYEETSVFDFNWGDNADSTKPTNLPAKYGEDFANYQVKAVLWSNMALAIGRSAEPSVEKERHAGRSAWEYVARSRFGTAMKYAEGVQVILADGGSGSAEGTFDV